MDSNIRREIEGILELDEKKQEIIARALSYAASEEFLCLGIGRYTEAFQALHGLFCELTEKLEPKGSATMTYTDVAGNLRSMSRHIKEGLDGYAFFPVDVDKTLRRMAFLEKYFTNK